MTVDMNRRVLPGYGLSLGYTVFYLSLLVAVPIAAGFLKAATLPVAEFWAAVSSDRAVAAYQLTVGASLVSAVAGVRMATGSPASTARHGRLSKSTSSYSSPSFSDHRCNA